MTYGQAAAARAHGRVLTALADPTRRKLFERMQRRDQTVGELANALRITQPAVSQHLRVLREANLVTQRREGTRRYYRPSPAGLAQLRTYIESLWDEALKAYAAGDPTPKKERSP